MEGFLNDKGDITYGVIEPNQSITNYSWVEMDVINGCIDLIFDQEKNTIVLCINDDVSAYPQLELNIFKGWKKLISGVINTASTTCTPEFNVSSLVKGKYLVVVSSPDGVYSCNSWLKVL